MEDNARRFVTITQDPEGYPVGLRDKDSTPLTAHTVVLEADYKKLFTELTELKADRLAENTCPVCGGYTSKPT